MAITLATRDRSSGLASIILRPTFVQPKNRHAPQSGAPGRADPLFGDWHGVGL